MGQALHAHDADRIVELYAEHAVNHQVVNAPVAGKAAICEDFRRAFAAAEVHCIIEVMHEAGEMAILEWKDPLGVRGCGFFTVREGLIVLQRGYWDRLSFFEAHRLPIA